MQAMGIATATIDQKIRLIAQPDIKSLRQHFVEIYFSFVPVETQVAEINMDFFHLRFIGMKLPQAFSFENKTLAPTRTAKNPGVQPSGNIRKPGSGTI
jgi:hypothetical protein